MNNLIVFCDFDGTITALETFVGMLKIFTPNLAEKILSQLYNRTLTLKEGVKTLLESIPSQDYPKILNYAYNQPIRDGLKELIDFLDRQNIPLVVILGGLQGMVETVLKREKLDQRVKAIVATQINTEGTFLKPYCAYEGMTDLVDKVLVMKDYPTQQSIVIGDSVTDIQMALKGDIVFARDRLIDYLEIEQKPYLKWDNFFDVRQSLEKIIV